MSAEQQKKPIYTDENPEAKYNLLGAFSILIEVDRRNHPEKYKKQQNDHD